jgi:hypothetical protein
MLVSLIGKILEEAWIESNFADYENKFSMSICGN